MGSKTDMARSMILVHFGQTFPFRALEWLMSIFLIGWGVVLLHPNYDPTATTFAAMFVQVPHDIFGRLCLLVGLIRFAALFINGMWWRTPFARLVTTFAASFIWVVIVFGLVASDVVGTGWAIYPACIVAELYNAFRSADDSKKSWRDRRAASFGRSG